MTDFRPWLIEAVQFTTTVFRDSEPGDAVNHCIEWCRVQTLVLEKLGVKCRALPVDVVAGNAKAVGQLLTNDPLTDELVADGAWTVGVHHNQQHDGTGWNGHLVVVVTKPEGGRILIDGTGDQFSRPQRGIDVAPIVLLDLPAMWVEPVFTDPKRQTGIVRYVQMPPGAGSAQTWRGSNAWTNPNLEVMAEFIADKLTPWVDVAG